MNKPEECDHDFIEIKEQGPCGAYLATGRFICPLCGTYADGKQAALLQHKAQRIKDFGMDQEPANAPPLGLRPRYIMTEKRIREITAAMTRYHEAKKQSPMEWVEELRDLTVWYYEWKKGRGEV